MSKNGNQIGSDAEALWAAAQAGGPGAALAARRAAALWEQAAPSRAREALALAVQLAPMDPAPRLGLARLSAEAGDLEAARTEAAAVLAGSAGAPAKASAAFMLGELARADARTDEARHRYTQALKFADAVLATDRSDPHAARWYARARGRIAELDAGAGNFAQAKTGAEGAL